MTKEYATIPFAGTPAQEQQLQEYMAECKEMKGALIPVMQKAQAIYGYLPIEVQTIVAKGLDIPLEEVYGVATFYSQFTLQPKGKHQVSICMGTACYVKGAGELLDRVNRTLNCATDECTEDGEFSIAATRCVGCCGLAPLITVNEKVYGKITADDAERILKNLMENK